MQIHLEPHEHVDIFRVRFFILRVYLCPSADDSHDILYHYYTFVHKIILIIKNDGNGYWRQSVSEVDPYCSAW